MLVSFVHTGGLGQAPTHIASEAPTTYTHTDDAVRRWSGRPRFILRAPPPRPPSFRGGLSLPRPPLYSGGLQHIFRRSLWPPGASSAQCEPISTLMNAPGGLREPPGDRGGASWRSPASCGLRDPPGDIRGGLPHSGVHDQLGPRSAECGLPRQH